MARKKPPAMTPAEIEERVCPSCRAEEHPHLIDGGHELAGLAAQKIRDSGDATSIRLGFQELIEILGCPEIAQDGGKCRCPVAAALFDAQEAVG
jgi:hypothetical protein